MLAHPRCAKHHTRRFVAKNMAKSPLLRLIAGLVLSASTALAQQLGPECAVRLNDIRAVTIRGKPVVTTANTRVLAGPHSAWVGGRTTTVDSQRKSFHDLLGFGLRRDRTAFAVVGRDSTPPFTVVQEVHRSSQPYGSFVLLARTQPVEGRRSGTRLLMLYRAAVSEGGTLAIVDSVAPKTEMRWDQSLVSAAFEVNGTIGVLNTQIVAYAFTPLTVVHWRDRTLSVDSLGWARSVGDVQVIQQAQHRATFWLGLRSLRDSVKLFATLTPVPNIRTTSSTTVEVAVQGDNSIQWITPIATQRSFAVAWTSEHGGRMATLHAQGLTLDGSRAWTFELRQSFSAPRLIRAFSERNGTWGVLVANDDSSQSLSLLYAEHDRSPVLLPVGKYRLFGTPVMWHNGRRGGTMLFAPVGAGTDLPTLRSANWEIVCSDPRG